MQARRIGIYPGSYSAGDVSGSCLAIAFIFAAIIIRSAMGRLGQIGPARLQLGARGLFGLPGLD